MHLSIGLEPDLKLVERLTFLQEDLGKILTARGADSRWIRPEYMYMPLLSVGQRDDDDVVEIVRLLSRTIRDVAPFQVTVSGIQADPSPACPRLIQVGVCDGRERIVALREKLHAAFVDASFPYDPRPFVPTFLLGRAVTKNGRVDLSDAIDAIKDLNFGPTEIFELNLLGANLLENRPIHQVLARCPLGGPSKP